MTFTPVGSPIHHYGATFTSFSLTPGGVGDLIMMEVENLTDHTVYCTGLSSSNVTWQQMGTPFLGSVNTTTAVLFAGRVTSTSAATVTVTWSGATPTTAEVAGQEFSTTLGGWTLDAIGHIDSSGTNNWASLTPPVAGDLYFGFASDPGTASGAGTTGYTYSVSGNGNGMAYNPSCGTSATFPAWTDGAQHLGIMALVREVGWNVLQSAKKGDLQGAAGNQSVQYPSAVSPGTKLIVSCITSAVDVTAVHDQNGTLFTRLADVDSTAGGCYGSLWVLDTPTVDVGMQPTITAVTTGHVSLIIMEVSGLKPGTSSAILDGTPGYSSGIQTGTITSPAYSSTASGEMLLTMFGCQNNAHTISGVSGSETYTIVQNLDGTVTPFSYESIAVATAPSSNSAETSTWALTTGSPDWTTTLVAFKVGGSAPTPGAGSVQSIWTPAIPTAPVTSSSLPATLGTEFSVSEAVSLGAIWYYSGTGCTVLPDNVALYAVSGSTLIAHNSSPSWSGAAGSGWIRCDMSSFNITLAASTNYMAAIGASGSGQYTTYTHNYFTAGSVTAGEVTAYGGWYGSSDIAFPGTFGSGDCYWVDVEVYIPNGTWSTDIPLNTGSTHVFGGYELANDVWNTGPAGPEMIWGTSASNWGASSIQGGSSPTAVKSYPCVAWPASPPSGALITSFPQIVGTFASTRPSDPTWIGDVGFDCWINNYAVEVFFLVDNQGQSTAGSVVGTYTSLGHTWTVYEVTSTHFNIWIDSYIDSGTVDLLAGFTWLISHGYLTSSATIAGINFGSEFCSTNNLPMTFSVSNYALNMSYYTENLCPNPSFETSLSGYTALTGTTLSQDATQGKAGRASMKVVTDGSVSGEGFSGPQVTVPANEGTTGSLSFYIMGETGTLTVSAVAGSTATVVGQTTVTLSGNDYTRVVLSGLTLTPGHPMYFLIQTPTAQALTFWVDAVQYEMNSPAHPYIDGSFLHCTWEGTPGLSASYQAFQFPTSAAGGMHLEGHATPVTQGEIFKTSAKGSMLLSGTESGTLIVNPVAALSAFGMWTTADMDPAVSYAPWSNAGLTTSSSWQRVLGLFQPPQQYVASNGQVLWNRAAYAAVGFWFKSIANTAQEMLADVQWERMPVVPGANPAPTTWQTPRQVSTIVKPTRLNFVPNPSIEISTADWTVIGSAAIAQDATVFVTGTGTHSLKVTVNAANDGAYITIPDLIIGDTYIVSASVQGGPGLQDVIMACSGASTSSSELGIPYGGGTFGGGPYGGIEATGADMPTGQWFLPNMIFTAQQSTVNLSFQSLVGSDVAYPTHFWVDALLLEAGEDLLTYFDGSFGTDYSWEGGGTAGLTRSYYYERSEVAAGAITTALAEHTPLGILAATPVYSSPYTQ